MEPCKHRALKTSKNYIQENYVTVGKREPALKSSCTDSLAPGLSTKTSICKAPRPYVQETHSSSCQRGRKPLGLPPGMESRAGAIFVTFYFAKVHACRTTLELSHLPVRAGGCTQLRTPQIPHCTCFLTAHPLAIIAAQIRQSTSPPTPTPQPLYQRG